MNFFLNIVSVISAFVFGVGILYWIMDVTVGRLKFLHSENEWYGLQVKDGVFLIIAILIILHFFTFYKPYL